MTEEQIQEVEEPKAQEETREAEAAEGKYTALTHEFVDIFDNDEEVEISLRFKRPTKSEVERCQKKLSKKSGEAFYNLCLRAIHPNDKAEFIRQNKKYPGVGSSFGNLLLKASGFAELGE